MAKYGPPNPKRRGAQIPSMDNKDYYNPRDRRSLPAVSPPPTYKPPTDANYYIDSDGKRNYRDQRPMADTGWPDGKADSRRGGGSPNRFGEWAPGEFERSYPKSDPKNAAWYKDHVFQSNDKRWVREPGPPTPVDKRRGKEGPPLKKPAAAASAVARAAAKGEPGKGGGEPGNGRKSGVVLRGAVRGMF